jgi:hypothetical protein
LGHLGVGKGDRCGNRVETIRFEWERGKVRAV